MKKRVNKFIRIIVAIVIFYLLICTLLFFQQESFIFFPGKLSVDHKFSFDQPFEEVFITTDDDVKLHGLLFKSSSSRGLVFYLHGNAGSADSWGWAAETYLSLNYDVFILDYRGYGKSEGKIRSEKQFYSDVQLAYDHLKKQYNEEDIVVIGYSIGTAGAAMLASQNNPKLLVLQAPYYSLTDLMQRVYPFLPTFILQYKFDTYRFVQNTKIPVYIFHGAHDELIDSNSSIMLEKHLKPNDQLFLLEGQGHNGMNENPQYRFEIGKILL